MAKTHNLKTKEMEQKTAVKTCWFDDEEGLFHCIMQDNTEWTSLTGSTQDSWIRVTRKEEGFVKDDSGKLQWSLLPFKQLESTVKVLMEGAKKYSRDNWKNCDDINRYKDALMRHVTAYIEGKKIDSKDEGGDDLPHLAHAICNCLFLMYFDEMEDKKDVESE